MKRLAWGVAVLLMVGPAVRAGGADEKAGNLSTRVYPVGDLVRTPRQHAETPGHGGVTPPELRPDFGPLVDLLTSTVAPETWTKNDGKDGRAGTITPFLLNNSLVVRATPAVHEQIGNRLRQLRRLPALRKD